MEQSENALRNVSSNLLDVENTISKLSSSLDEDAAQLELKEEVKLNVGLAFALGSLYFILLNSKGAEGVQQQPINEEIERIKKYVVRVSKLDEQPSVRMLTVDSAAAARMVKYNLEFAEDDSAKKRKT